MRDLTERNAVVVGGGSGIGRGVALGLAEAGARVAVADIDPASAESVAAEIEARGHHARPFVADGTERDSLTTLAAGAEAELGPIHVLSNNVGVSADIPLDRATEADWGWFIDFNLMSIVRSVDVFLPALRAHGDEGHIVNTASMAAVVAQGITTVPIHLGLYTTTKHAVLGYSELLRDELADEGIGVSVLCPGRVHSDLGRTSARHRPAIYGGPLEEPEEPPGALTASVMQPEAVGSVVVRGILANRLHLFTHPERRGQVEARHRRMLEDFDFADGNA